MLRAVVQVERRASAETRNAGIVPCLPTKPKTRNYVFSTVFLQFFFTLRKSRAFMALLRNPLTFLCVKCRIWS